MNLLSQLLLTHFFKCFQYFIATVATSACCLKKSVNCHFGEISLQAYELVAILYHIMSLSLDILIVIISQAQSFREVFNHILLI